MDAAAIEVRPISPAIGAEVVGVDLSRELGNAAFDAVHRAFIDHGALFFRDQDLTPASLVAFARRFGSLNIHPMMKGLDGHPEVLEIVKNPEDRNNFGGAWHTDLSYLEKPSLGSMLYATELPDLGGDTLFANMYLAYDALSEGMKEMLAPLKAVHSTSIVYTEDTQDQEGIIGSAASMQRRDREREDEEAVHPVVRTHPETGRKALYVNRTFTTRFERMTAAESAPVLQFLFAHLERPEFACRFRWSARTLAFWDNRCTQHYAVNDYHGHRRVMHRVAIEGDRPT
jgi:taurine dioxygenase